MTMIGPDELGELSERLQALFQTLLQNKKACDSDQQAARRLLEWVIYPEWETQTKDLDIRPIQWSDGLPPPHRDLLIEAAQASAAFVKSGKSRDKMRLSEACEALLRARGVVFGDQFPDLGEERVDRQTDARDKFVYQKICKGASAKQVWDSIDQHPNWEAVPEAQMLACATRYARRHGLPLPKQ